MSQIKNLFLAAIFGLFIAGCGIGTMSNSIVNQTSKSNQQHMQIKVDDWEKYASLGEKDLYRINDMKPEFKTPTLQLIESYHRRMYKGKVQGEEQFEYESIDIGNETVFGGFENKTSELRIHFINKATGATTIAKNKIVECKPVFYGVLDNYWFVCQNKLIKYDGKKWAENKTINSKTFRVWDFKIVDNIPYLLLNFDNDEDMYLYRYIDGSWVQVGYKIADNSSFDIGGVIALDSKGRVYVSYATQDYSSALFKCFKENYLKDTTSVDCDYIDDAAAKYIKIKRLENKKCTKIKGEDAENYKNNGVDILRVTEKGTETGVFAVDGSGQDSCPVWVEIPQKNRTDYPYFRQVFFDVIGDDIYSAYYDGNNKNENSFVVLKLEQGEWKVLKKEILKDFKPYDNYEDIVKGRRFAFTKYKNFVYLSVGMSTKPYTIDYFVFYRFRQ